MGERANMKKVRRMLQRLARKKLTKNIEKSAKNEIRLKTKAQSMGLTLQRTASGQLIPVKEGFGRPDNTRFIEEALHGNSMIARVIRDGAVKLPLSRASLAVLAATPYGGTYEQCIAFLEERNLRLYMLENGWNYNVIAEHHGHEVAQEITNWAHQLTSADMKALEPFSPPEYVEAVAVHHLSGPEYFANKFLKGESQEKTTLPEATQPLRTPDTKVRVLPEHTTPTHTRK